MTLIKDLNDCSTYSVRGLDNQLVAQMNKISPGLLVDIRGLNVSLGEAVHPWLQAQAANYLKKAVEQKGQTLVINSAYRTIAGQILLRSHYEAGRCGIVAAAQPGSSNHNNASAIDIEDPWDWKDALEHNGWQKLGSWDDMHFDCLYCEDILSISTLAFQQLWNECRPKDKVAEDGAMGQATMSRLRYAPAEGFPEVIVHRVMKLTDPVQVGDDVGKVQLALRSHGISLEKADKVFGKATQAGVMEFQRRQGLLPDGIVGDATRKALGLE